jgi:hypothetical protein
MANVDQNQDVHKKEYNEGYSGNNNEEQGGGFDIKIIS